MSSIIEEYGSMIAVASVWIGVIVIFLKIFTLIASGSIGGV